MSTRRAIRLLQNDLKNLNNTIERKRIALEDHKKLLQAARIERGEVKEALRILEAEAERRQRLND